MFPLVALPDDDDEDEGSSHFEPYEAPPSGATATEMCGCCLVETEAADGTAAAETSLLEALRTCLMVHEPGMEETLPWCPGVAAAATTF